MGIATTLQTGVETAVLTFANLKSAALAAALVPVAVTGATIYVFLIGWAIARGELHNPLSTTLWKFFKIAAIGSIALGGGMYQSYVIEFITGIEGVFTNAIGGAPGIGALIDASIVPMETLTGELYKKANEPFIPNMSLLAAAVLCTFGQVVVTACALIPLLVAKVTVGILLAVGPAFVLMAMWPVTQRFTEAWLSATLASVATVAIVAAVVGFLPSYMQSYATVILGNINNPANNFLQDVVALVLSILVLAWIAWKSAEMGASLVAGASFGNPASTLASYVVNRMRPNGPPPQRGAGGNNRIQQNGGGVGVPLAHQNVITNLHRKR